MMVATAKSILRIGPATDEKSADFVAADFTALTGWVDVGNMINLGSLGDQAQAITQALISEGRDKTIKGTRNAGTMEVVCATDYADAGQLALIAAEKQPYAFAFQLEFADKPASGASPKNSKRYFIAKVMSASEAMNEANSVMQTTFSLAVNSNIVRVAASAT